MGSIIYKEYLYEAIPAAKDSRDLWYHYLKDKYTDLTRNANLYVTFVSIDKVGINPKSIHNTPSGVYCYPMNYVLMNRTVPFMGEYPEDTFKVKVIEAINDNSLSDKTTEEDFNKVVLKLKQMDQQGLFRIDEGFDKFIKYAVENAIEPIELGFIWNITRLLSSNYHRASDTIRNKRGVDNRNTDIFYWSKLLIELGFDYAVDNGYGIIHSNEPTQAVFLNPKSYRAIDETFVSTHHKYLANSEYYTKGLLKALVRSGWDNSSILTALELRPCTLLKVKDKNGEDALAYSLKDEFIELNEIVNIIDKCFVKNGELINKKYYLTYLIGLALHNSDNFKHITSTYKVFQGSDSLYSDILFKLFNGYKYKFIDGNKEVVKSINYILDLLDFKNMFHVVNYKIFLLYMEEYYTGPNKELLLTEFAKYLAEGEAKMEDLESLLKDTP